MRRLPPLSAVRAFEAAGRLEHFTAAARELGMTQAAVSYQVRLLEERLGVALFRRERRRVVLTDAGRRALAKVSAGFDMIDAAFAGLRAEDESVLTISATPTFASCWLAARLGGFQLRHPELAVRLDTTNRLVDFATEEVDCALRVGPGEWAGLSADFLFEVDFTPMATPAFRDRHRGIDAAAMAAAGAISPYDPWWEPWCRAAGIAALPQLPRRGGVRLDSQALEGSAVKAGQGVALLTPMLWQEELHDGRMVRLSPVTATAGERYCFVCPAERRRVPKIARFREWLLTEIAASRAQLASLPPVC